MTMNPSHDLAQQTHKITTSWASSDGKFRRAQSAFRNSIEPHGRFPPERNRYHLYVSLACPWAHRTLIYLHLKGLQNIISTSIVHPHIGRLGWSWTLEDQDLHPSFSSSIDPTLKPDPLYSAQQLRQIYFKADPNYQARFTVPVLFDSKNHTIVNNESSEIIRIFNSSFDHLLDQRGRELDLYPTDLRASIDELNEWIYDRINNGVYKAGFATTQDAYLEAVESLFESLDRVESILGRHRFLVGDRLTEADIRLYPTIVRFDVVYVSHFKCNLRTIRHGYPHIHRWLKELYHWKDNPAFRETTNFDHIKIHYFTSHPQINPTRIIPQGPLPAIEPADRTHPNPPPS